MPSFIRSPKDFLSGLMFLAVGLAAIIIAREYPMGAAIKMGAGYFPTVLSGLLILIGAVCMLRSLAIKGPSLEKTHWKPLFLITVSTILFGFLLRTAGFPFAAAALVFLSAYASIKFRWVVAFRIFMIMALFCYLVFVKALTLPMPLLGSWFGG